MVRREGPSRGGEVVAKERKADLESQSSVWQAVTGLAREKAPDDLALMSVGEFWESSLPKPTLSRTLPSETKQGKGATSCHGSRGPGVLGVVLEPCSVARWSLLFLTDSTCIPSP